MKGHYNTEIAIIHVSATAALYSATRDGVRPSRAQQRANQAGYSGTRRWFACGCARGRGHSDPQTKMTLCIMGCTARIKLDLSERDDEAALLKSTRRSALWRLKTSTGYFCSASEWLSASTGGGTLSFASLAASPNQEMAPQRVHIRALVSTKLSFSVQNFVFFGTK